MRRQTQRWAIGAGAAIGAGLVSALWFRRSRAPSAYRPGDGARWAVITGASSGIGAAFARRLAGDQYHLLLIARRRERLEQLGAELSRQHSVRVETLPADLARDADIAGAAQRVSELDRLALLVNNAGFGTVGAFASLSATSQTDMIRLHTEAPARLTRAALPAMLARKQGAIINVSSTAAFFALPGNATYCATKRFLVTFSQALGVELAGQGVTAQALCPGFTHTGFHATEHFRSGGNRLPQTPALLWMTPEQVVTCSLRALGREVVCVPGVINKLIARLPALLPPDAIGRAVDAFGL
jgi:short-subunit dehydrogenase